MLGSLEGKFNRNEKLPFSHLGTTEHLGFHGDVTK